MEGGRPIPIRVHTIVISTQHSEDISQEEIQRQLMEVSRIAFCQLVSIVLCVYVDHLFSSLFPFLDCPWRINVQHVIRPVVPAEYLDEKTIYHLNPSGRFVIGGPHGDAGLTGRKIIIDTYGGWGAHGGGAFSGKDTTKVDRSAAYAARWVAKSLVAAGLCHRVLVQLSYAIGLAFPLSVFVDSYGTGLTRSGKTDAQLTEIVNANFDLRPGGIIRDLNLRRPVLKKVRTP